MAAEADPLAEPARPRVRVPLKIEEVAIAAAMAGIALITAANVVTRYLSNISLAFTEEYSILLMVIATLLGAAYATASGRHIRIGYFVERLPPAGQRLAEIAGLLLVIVCFLVILAFGLQLTWDEYRFGVPSPGLGHPQWLYTGCLPALSLFVIGRAAGRAIRLWRGEPS